MKLALLLCIYVFLYWRGSAQLPEKVLDSPCIPSMKFCEGYALKLRVGLAAASNFVSADDPSKVVSTSFGTSMRCKSQSAQLARESATNTRKAASPHVCGKGRQAILLSCV